MRAVCPQCSSLDIDRDQNPDNQLLQLRDYAERQGWLLTKEFVDRESGSHSDRPQFNAMFSYLRRYSRRKETVVLFWALDRISREGIGKVFQYLTELQSLEVDWVSTTEEFFRSFGPFKDLMVSISATLANYERQRLIERTLAGIARARERGTKSGKPIGRPRKHHFDQADLIRHYDETHSISEAARRCNIPKSQASYKLRDYIRSQQRQETNNPTCSQLGDNQ